MNQADVIVANNRSGDVVIWRKNDGKLLLICQVGVKQSTADSEDTRFVDEGVVRAKRL